MLIKACTGLRRALHLEQPQESGTHAARERAQDLAASVQPAHEASSKTTFSCPCSAKAETVTVSSAARERAQDLAASVQPAHEAPSETAFDCSCRIWPQAYSLHTKLPLTQPLIAHAAAQAGAVTSSC